MNKKLLEWIEVFKCFEESNRTYWLLNTSMLCNADKGFLLIYFNL